MSDPASTFVTRAPHPRLRPFVESYTGYFMDGFAPGTHAGLPSGTLTLIVSFGDPLDVDTPSSERNTYWGMLGGLHAAPATVHHTGRQHGIQLGITPRGADALFATPAAEIADTLVHLGDLVPSFGDELVERLSAAPNWRRRWAALDQVLLRELTLERPLPTELEHAWARLRSTHGAASVAALADEVGWSRRHFTKRFQQTYGLTPKLMGRILRFERAQSLARLPTRPSLASIALAAGYADQAHMTREWVEFAGVSPTRWLADETIPTPEQTDDSEVPQDKDTS